MNLYNNTACFLLLVSCLFGQEALADQSYYILDPEESGAQLQSSISSPADFLGFEIGDRAIRHNEAILYFRYLGNNSDRAEFAQYGATSAGRELFRLVISDPDNLQKLPEIKGTLDRISSNAEDSAALIESTPAVAWMGYGIHGDELASSDAAVMLAFRLIAGEEDEIREIRRKLFTYVDPMHNPDGRARALQHVDGIPTVKVVERPAGYRAQPILDEWSRQSLLLRPEQGCCLPGTNAIAATCACHSRRQPAIVCGFP